MEKEYFQDWDLEGFSMKWKHNACKYMWSGSPLKWGFTFEWLG